MHSLSTIALLFTLALSARGETTWRVVPLPSQSQLPVSCVHCILQDQDGYMWYGTPGGGLCRDNGFQVDVFNPGNQLASGSSIITSLAEGQNKDIWIGTNQGLFLLDKRDYCIKSVLEQKFANQRITKVLCEEHDVWVSIQSRIYRLDEGGQLKHTYELSTRNTTHTIYRDGQGRLWVTQWGGGLALYDAKRDTFVPQSWADGYSILNIQDIGNGLLLMGTWGDGILLYDTQTGKFTAEDASMGWFEKQCVIDMLWDAVTGLLWVTTNDNLYLYRLQQGHLLEVDTKDFLAQGKKILDYLARDREGNIWVSGFTPGTFVLTPTRGNLIKRYPIPEMRQATGYSVLADRSLREGKKMWIWQGRVGLTLYDEESGRLTFSDFYCERNIQSCKTLGHGIWVTNEDSLFHVYEKDGRIVRSKAKTVPDKKMILRLGEDGGNTIYVATQKNLFAYQPGRDSWSKVISLKTSAIDLEVDAVTSVCYLLLNDNMLLSVRPDGTTKTYRHQGQKLAAMAIGTDGTLWLTAFNGKTFRYDSKANNLLAEGKAYNNANSPVRDIKVDGLGHVWTVFDQEVIEQNPTTDAFRRILATDSEVGVDYFYGAEQDDALHLRLNGAGAICQLQSSERLNSNYEEAEIDISSYITEGTKHFLGNAVREIEITPENSGITLLLSVRHWAIGETHNFAYRLKGHNSEWTYCTPGSNSISFSKLPSGNYDLLVKATDRNGCWSEECKLVTIIVLTPWYRTWWAIVLYGLIIMASIYGLWRLEKRILLLSRLIRRRQEVRLDEVELKREDVTSEHLDDTFLHDVMDHIKANIGNADYNVETMAQDLCMSRMNLYRKVKALTGLTPSALLREVRLKTAAQLLTSRPDVSINDVARRVGFTSSSYFAKSFKEQFGVLPSDFGNNKRTET